MMKLIRTIVGFLSLLFICGGSIVLGWQYFRNKQLFVVLMSNSIVKGSMSVLRIMFYAVLAIILGLILFSCYLKIAAYVRKIEKEKTEALIEAQAENEEINRKLKKEAEEARAEADRVKQENELMKITFMRKPEEENQEAAPAEEDTL